MEQDLHVADTQSEDRGSFFRRAIEDVAKHKHRALSRDKRLQACDPTHDRTRVQMRATANGNVEAVPF